MIVAWNGETLPALPLEQEIGIAAAAGYDGLELFVPKLGPYLEHRSALHLAECLHQKGLTPVAMNGIENINLRTAEEFAGIERDCLWLAQLAQAIGCPTIVVVPSPLPSGVPWSEAKARTAEALRALGDIGAAHDVRIAFEFLAPARCSVRTLSQALEIVQASGRPNVGLVLDTFHFYAGGSSWQSLEEADASRLFLVHINDVADLPLDLLTDGDRLLPGEGVLPLAEILRRLRAHGYDGAYSLEVMRPAYRARDPLEYARAGRQAIERLIG